MEIGLEQNVKMKSLATKHDISSSKQKFQSDDSEGSDLSYESSLTDEDDNEVGRIQFFKEQMARFFINYPQLINKNIIQDEGERDVSDDEQKKNANGNFNKNWQSIADGIFNEVKESSTSLESLAKRISLYRYKIDQCDIIDLLLQQKNSILKEIQSEIVQKKSQSNLVNQSQKQDDNIEKRFREDNSYLSWRKRKQFQFKMKSNQHNQRSESLHNSKNFQTIPNRDVSTTGQKFKSLQKYVTSTKLGEGRRDKSSNQKINRSSIASQKNFKKMQNFRGDKDSIKNMNMEDSQVGREYGSTQLTSNWRHLVNFQPKTEIGRQLCEDIKKKNTPTDEPGIKKTIIEFLVNYKELINNEVINKATLSQKIQKLYSEEAKQLLMFYPSKINTYENPTINSSNNFRDSSNEDKFMDLLKRINDGPLIKYWRELQQSKI